MPAPAPRPVPVVCAVIEREGRVLLAQRPADKLLPLKPKRECISCHKEYDRKATTLFRPLGVFENYCLCEECLHKDKHGWGDQH